MKLIKTIFTTDQPAWTTAMSKYMFSIVLLLLSFYTKAQSQQPYPQSYFRLPLTISPSLAGNFGDLRTNHYHMGLDIRTQQRENLTVVAAADGYVSHVRVEPYGYGRALYITHFNGYTTVYAHLNSFFPALEAFVRERQYSTQSWEQNFDLLPLQFPVQKGQMIALSGNTGGSQGPHLHFEIRESGLDNGKNINPLLFGLGIADHVPPVLYRVGVFNRDESIYESRPLLYPVTKKSGVSQPVYGTAQPVIKVPSGRFSLGLAMQDKMDNSFTFGVYQASLYLDDRLRSRFVMEKNIYEESRYINAGIDYFTKYNGGAYMQLLSRLPGNESPFFDTAAGDGILELPDDAVHNVMIEVADAAGNTSVLRFAIQRDRRVAFSNNLATAPVAMLPPNRGATFDTTGVQLITDKEALYDTVWLRYNVKAAPAPAVSNLYSIGDYRIPVHSHLTLRLQPSQPLPDSVKRKTIMVMRSGKRNDARQCNWKGEMAEAEWRYFGQFYLTYDAVPPSIRPVNVREKATFNNNGKLIFDAFDETGDLARFEGYIDGKWVIFRQKNDRYTYDFDERCGAGWHEIEVKATDLAGNEKFYRASFYNSGK